MKIHILLPLLMLVAMRTAYARSMYSPLHTRSSLSSRLCSHGLQGGFSLENNMISPNELAFVKAASIPVGAYLLLYKPVERTTAFFDKVSELLRIGESQKLLSGLDDPSKKRQLSNFKKESFSKNSKICMCALLCRILIIFTNSSAISYCTYHYTFL